MARKRLATGWRIDEVEVRTYGHRNRAKVERIRQPSKTQVDAALSTLDAERRSDLAICASNGSLMCVGGGAGKYHVQITFSENSPYTPVILIDPRRKGEEENLIVGGVVTPLPARMIVDMKKLLRAARTFVEQGVPDPKLTWEPC